MYLPDVISTIDPVNTNSVCCQTDWNDGRVSNELVRSLGGPAPPPSRLRRDPARWEENNQMAIDAAKKIGKYFVSSFRVLRSARKVDKDGLNSSNNFF